MDVWEAISRQRAVREFTDRRIEPELLDRIVEAGSFAPSSKNEQRWGFIACTDREHLVELSRVGDYAGHLAGAAAAVALITPEAEEGWRRQSIAFDLGQAAQSMMLAAWELGIGSVHAAVYDQGLTRELLGYPRGYRCDYLISFGYPADASIVERGKGRRARRPLSEMVHRERW